MPLAVRSGDFLSTSVLNSGLIHKMTGEEIQDLPSYAIMPGMTVFCIEDSPDGTFKQDNKYKMKTDLSGWDLEGLSTHNHIDDASGGTLSETLIANIPTT